MILALKEAPLVFKLGFFFFIAAKMTAQIVMTHDYPKVAPVFVVSVLWQHERTAANDKHIKVRTCTRKSSLLHYKLERLL